MKRFFPHADLTQFSANIKLFLELVSGRIVNQIHSFKNKQTHANQNCSSAYVFFIGNNKKKRFLSKYIKIDKIYGMGKAKRKKNVI